MPFPPSRPLVTLTGTRTTEKHKRLFKAIRQISVNSAVVYLLFTGLILYLWAPVSRILTAPETAVAEEYFKQSTYTMEGIIVRKETTIPYPNIRAVPTIEDGQAIAAGTQIAVSGDQAILAPAAGIYLREIDGYEHLTEDMLSGITAAELERLKQTDPANSPALGKIISGNGWLFAALVETDCVEALQEGQSIRLTIQADTSMEVTAAVLQISLEENGKCAVVFRCIDHLQSTAHLRHLTATINSSSIQGLRIPTEAVYTDEAGSFVYILSASQAEKRYVTILSEDNDFTIVSQDSSAHALHAGDTIILSAPF